MINKRKHPAIKTVMHPQNKHRGRYDLQKLSVSHPPLKKYILLNKYKDESINFSDPNAVQAINTALLKHYYGIKEYSVPKNYLFPPVPGRADYIHHIAEHLAKHKKSEAKKETKVRCLDIGVGANCIYPIIGNHAYGWDFVGTDIDPVAIAAAQQIIDSNPPLDKSISLRLQPNKKLFLRGIIKPKEHFDLMICNPPFHASKEEAINSTIRKLRNLNKTKNIKTVHNFGGQNNELWTEGGEKRFVKLLIQETAQFADICDWFSCLISKESNLKIIERTLIKQNAKDATIIPMGQGNKKSRIIVWRF